MKWLAASCALCAGCDLLFDVHGFDVPPLDAVTLVDGVDGGATGACSTMAMLADDFKDNDFDVLWDASVNVGNTLTEQAGNVQLSMAQPGSYITISSKAYYAMQESSFAIDLQSPDFSSSDTIALTLASEQPGNSVQWYRFISDPNVDTMSVAVIANGVAFPAGQFLFDPVADRYLRTRFAGDRVYFETAPDGATYTVQQSAIASGITFAQVNLQLFQGDSASPFKVLLADVNGGTPQGTSCDVSQLHDTFDSNVVQPQWARSSAFGGSFSEVSGQLVLSTNVPPMGNAGNRSVVFEPSARYDLSNGSMTIDVEQMLTPIEGTNEVRSIRFAALTAIGDAIEFQQHGGKLEGHATKQGQAYATPFSSLWEPVAMKWWRIAVRTDAMGVSTASWSISRDGKAWIEIITNATLKGFDRTDLALVMQVTAPTAEMAIFDNFNITPP